jgi:hypothetical protein
MLVQEVWFYKQVVLCISKESKISFSHLSINNLSFGKKQKLFKDINQVDFTLMIFSIK